MATILQNMHYFLQSEILSRRLAYFCCKKIAAMFNEYSNCFFESTIKKLQQQHQSPNPAGANGSSSLLTPLPASNLLLAQQKSPELNLTNPGSLQLSSSTQSASTTPPTKLKPFVTNANLSANPAKLPATPSQNKLAPFMNEASTAAVNEIINYKLVNSVSLKSVRNYFKST